jgi:hypothetical protein
MALASTSYGLSNLRWPLLFSALLITACGGKSASESPGGSGGTGASEATGGSSTSGGSSGTSTGGDAELGGSTSTGGDANKGGTAGGAAAGTGDTSSGATGGTGGSSDGAGTGGAPSCTGVVCAPIPKTCKMIEQEPGACCPTCPDTGCDVCPDLVCAAGTHAETVPGDCCPTCRPDADVDACMMGQAAYEDERANLIEKYGSAGCLNSADCGIATEQNACASTCGVALPMNTIKNFESNTLKAGAACSTCPSLDPPPCAVYITACVNGECTLEPARIK